MDEIRSFSVLISSDKAAGKSSLLERFITNSIPTGIEPSVGTLFKNYYFQFNNQAA
jgi:GTPase SAR1 family protein